MQGGWQQLNLQPYNINSGCFMVGTIIHEFMHALGFHHMQSASERDDYVRIAWENIESGSEGNFNKYSSSTITNFGVCKLLKSHLSLKCHPLFLHHSQHMITVA